VPYYRDSRIISIQGNADADLNDLVLASLSKPFNFTYHEKFLGNSKNGNTGQQIESSTHFDTSDSKDSVVGSSGGQSVCWDTVTIPNFTDDAFRSNSFKQ
jgi:hypothetical protein